MPRSLSFLSAVVLVLTLWTGPGRALMADVEAVTNAQSDLNLGLSVGGRIIAKHVEPGSVVRKGQLLIELEDKVGEAAVAVQKMQADNDVAIRAGAADLKMRKIELTRSQQLFDKNALTEIQLMTAQTEEEISRLKLEQARKEKEMANLQYERVKEEHARYKLYAPIDGTIEKIEPDKGEEVSVGETVEPGQSILRLVFVKSLRIDAAVTTVATLTMKVGDRAWVRAAMSEHNQIVDAKVVHVAKIADAASNTRLVRVEVPNENEAIGAGWTVTVYFTEPAPMATGPTSNRMPGADRAPAK